jgi:hypothetical protein
LSRCFRSSKTALQRPLAEYVFETDCISSDGESINDMRDHDDMVYVSYRTMRRRCVGLADKAKELGYGRWLTLKGDWHVSYHRSIYRGRPCYYMVWSAIEYIWVLNGHKIREEACGP